MDPLTRKLAVRIGDELSRLRTNFSAILAYFSRNILTTKFLLVANTDALLLVLIEVR